MMPFYLLQAQTNNAANYLPIVIQLFFALGLVFTIIWGSDLLGPKRATSDKLGNFESGIEIKGNARQPMAIKYFLVAILFVLFDVEVIFMYPWAVNFKELGILGIIEMFSFIILLLVGFYYLLAKKALKWED
jgi:NADH-quinone oxidoreductase subunit A